MESVTVLRSELHHSAEFVEKIKELFLPLVDRSWLPPELFQERCEAPLRYLLHRSDAVTIFAIASPPGFVSTIHDHGSWGVVGQVMGVEREVTYELAHEESGPVRELVGLSEKASTELTQGDVVAIVPPDRDVHHVATLGTTVSVSLHAFGRDPLSAGFIYFEPRLYAPLRHSGRYDNEPPSEPI